MQVAGAVEPVEFPAVFAIETDVSALFGQARLGLQDFSSFPVAVDVPEGLSSLSNLPGFDQGGQADGQKEEQTDSLHFDTFSAIGNFFKVFCSFINVIGLKIQMIRPKLKSLK